MHPPPPPPYDTRRADPQSMSNAGDKHDKQFRPPAPTSKSAPRLLAHPSVHPSPVIVTAMVYTGAEGGPRVRAWGCQEEGCAARVHRGGCTSGACDRHTPTEKRDLPLEDSQLRPQTPHLCRGGGATPTPPSSLRRRGKRSAWRCPICRRIVTEDTLVLCKLTESVVAEMPKDFEVPCAEGTWGGVGREQRGGGQWMRRVPVGGRRDGGDGLCTGGDADGVGPRVFTSGRGGGSIEPPKTGGGGCSGKGLHWQDH